MLNISNLKEGDTVVFRNGGRSKVCLFNDVRLLLRNSLFDKWNCLGKHIYTADLDIVEIIPKPEPVITMDYAAWYKDNGLMPALTVLRDVLELHPKADAYFKISVVDGVPSINKVERV